MLRGLLRDTDTNVCVAAVEAIAALGIDGSLEVVPALLGCLDASDEFTRLAALDGLHGLGVHLPWDRLAKLREGPALEHAVLVSSGQSGDTRAALPLIPALPHARGGTLVETLRSVVDLARSGPAPARELKIVAAGLDAVHTRAPDRSRLDGRRRGGARHGAFGAGALGVPGAAGHVLDALADEMLQGAAEEALDWLGPLAVPPLGSNARGAPRPHGTGCVLRIAARLTDDANAAIVQHEALAALARSPTGRSRPCGAGRAPASRRASSWSTLAAAARTAVEPGPESWPAVSRSL